MQSVLAEIDLGRIRKNALLLIKTAKLPLIAVVKDDAYGHGAVRVAHALEGIASSFAVATAEEGANLRAAGIERDILVLTPPLSREEAFRMRAYDLIASVSSPAFFGVLKRVHLAVNTGMNRYGVHPDGLSALCRAAKRANLSVEGMYSHLYAPEDPLSLSEQKAAFFDCAKVFKDFFADGVCHLAATGGMLAGAGGEAFRAGIGLYGYLPAGFEGRLNVRPAMKLYAAVAEARVPFGNGAGYRRSAERYSALYTLRAGYGDGFFRAGGLGGTGKLCMDACVCAGSKRAGARVRILPDLEAYAAENGTTVYEVLVRVAGRAEKVYLDRGRGDLCGS